MARSRWAAIAAFATITLAACAGGGDKSAAEGGQVGDQKAAASVKVARDFEDLSEALDIAVPDGYMLQPDDLTDTGPTDLEKAVRDDAGDDARDVLTRTGFVRGYQRMWSRSPGEEIVSYVYQFAEPAGATEYTQRVAAAAAAPADGVSTDAFRVLGIADSSGVTVTAPASTTSSVIFARGPYSVEVVITSASPAGLEAFVTALAEEQYSRL